MLVLGQPISVPREQLGKEVGKNPFNLFTVISRQRGSFPKINWEWKSLGTALAGGSPSAGCRSRWKLSLGKGSFPLTWG